MGIGSVERGGTRNDPNLDYRDYTFTKKDRRHTSPARSLYRSPQSGFGDIGATKTKPTVSTNK
tara:strand:+ start:74 stop:262 length:189 start_codon:yes stop_codon:yes gene_type:complete